MKLIFSWQNIQRTMTPTCRVESSTDSPLCDLLMDDGGLGISSAVSWVSRGLEYIQSVLEGSVADGEWSRETWGARFDANRTTVYSLHDENYTEFISTLGFKETLFSWLSFIQTTPDLNYSVTIEVK